MPKSNDNPTPNDDTIAKRAYELYLQRGSVSGHELDDWLASYRQLWTKHLDRLEEHLDRRRQT